MPKKKRDDVQFVKMKAGHFYKVGDETILVVRHDRDVESPPPYAGSRGAPYHLVANAVGDHDDGGLHRLYEWSVDEDDVVVTDLGKPELFLPDMFDGVLVYMHGGQLFAGCTVLSKRETKKLFRDMGAALGYEVER